MQGEVSDEVLWSWLDRGAAELEEHLARCPEDRPRVETLRASIAGLAAAADARERLPDPIDGFRILRALGRGGMGVVYEAEQQHPRRRVALKVVRDGARADPTRLALFRREVDALARLAHPGIAAVHAAGATEAGDPWFAMELAEGVTLAAWARDRAPSRRERVELVRRIAAALAHAHARGVVHCDLKPSNVVVSDAGEPKVLDFGLARIVAGEEELSRTSLAGGLAGTLPYASPEQARGERSALRPASDVWSLGVILYELLTGALPHDHAGASLVESARRIAEREPIPPGARDKSLRGDLEAVVLHALEREPSRRYADAGALAEDLGRWLGGLPVAAHRPTLARRLAKLVRRRKLATAAVLAIAALLFLASYAVVFPTNLPWPIGGDWFAEGAPWEELRWRATTPEVRLGDRWYELEAIDGLAAPYVVGFAMQNADRSWRKRFSEDLIQVLNRMGNACWFDVDLGLRDLETGERVEIADVPLDAARRRSTVLDRNSWPFDPIAGLPQPLCRYEGRIWVLDEVEGLPARELFAGGALSYDRYCEVAGRSPPPELSFVLRDPETGEQRELAGIARRVDRSRAPRDAAEVAAEAAR